jgi:threonine dehydratase
MQSAPIPTYPLDPMVRAILTARVYEAAIETPCERANHLSKQLGCSVYLKREDLQPVHSFKIRGAYNKIAQLTAREQKCGIITASAGNHAQGVALSAKKLGLSALIVMPRTTPVIKIDAVKRYGATIELHGDNYSEAAAYCAQRATETGRTYIHPFDDPLVIAGQGTIGREIIEQLPEVTHVFIPTGGGGLLAGIASYVKAIRPDIRIISVEPVDSSCMASSIAQGTRVELPHVGIFADGVAVKQAGQHTFAIAQKMVDDFVTVTTDQVCSAVKDVYETTRSIVEPSGALGVAALMQYPLPSTARAVAICSGANITFERLQQIAERTRIGSGREALIAVQMDEQPGVLSRLCHEVIRDRAITELSYRLQSRQRAQVLLGVSVQNTADRNALLTKIKKHTFAVTDLSDDEIAKEHIRYMIGGTGTAATHEHFYHIDFPERSGALADFLTTLGNQWNISLFHYRSAASDVGRVLIGFEAVNRSTLEKRLEATNLTFSRVTISPALQLFCQLPT